MERRALGEQFEQTAFAHYQRLGHRLIARNLRLGRYEIDLLFWDERAGRLLLVEVRGRTGTERRPRKMLTRQKRQTLEVCARRLSARYRSAIAMELCEVVQTIGGTRVECLRMHCG